MPGESRDTVPGFRLYVLAHAISWSGSAMTLVALPILIYQRTGSAALTGLLAGLEALPYLLFGLPVGAVVDRWDQRRTMIVTGLVSGVAMAGIPVANWLGVVTTGQLLASAAVIATVFVFFNAASFGALPALVGRARIAAATGKMAAVSAVIELGGPALGGALVTTVGAANLIAVDALSYVIAAIVLTRVRWQVPAQGALPTGRRRSSVRLRAIRDDARDGLEFIWSHDVVRTLTLLGIGVSLTAGAVTGLLVVVAVRRLGLGEHDARLGLLYAALAAGALIGSITIARWQRRAPVGMITLAALGSGCLTLVVWALTTSWPVGIVVLIAWQACATTAILNGIIVRQTITPQPLQARVNTTARMIAWGGTPFGAIIAGVLAEAIGTRDALLAATAVLAATTVAGFVRLRATSYLDVLIDDFAAADALHPLVAGLDGSTAAGAG